MNFFNNANCNVPKSYKDYAIKMYALYCKIFYKEDLGFDLNEYKQLISFMEEKNYLSLEIPYETDLGIQYILEDEEDYKCLPMIGEDYKHLPRISKNITSIKNEVLK